MTGFRPGDGVFGSARADILAAPGTFAEFTVAPASRLIKKPAGLTCEEAANAVAHKLGHHAKGNVVIAV